MAERRTLHFNSEADCVADVTALKSGYVAEGSWTLSQIAFHCGFPIAHPFAEPKTTEVTPEQAKMQQFLDMVAAKGWPDSKLDSPPPMVPPKTANPMQTEEFITNLKRLAAYDKPLIDAGPFGPVTTEKYRRFVLNHAAHHLAFLKPVKRREIKYNTDADLFADLKRLQRGYTQLGKWNLSQCCWHLAKAAEFSMRPGPFPELTPQQLGAKPMKDAILASGRLPIGISAPDGFEPPADASEAEIDHLITAMEKATAFKGDFAPHRVFGVLTHSEAAQLRLFHCAHHLSYLIPTHQESESNVL